MSLKILTNNWQVKLLAFLVATAMWVYAASSATNIAKFPAPIPIRTINLTPGLVALYDQKEVKIEVAADPTVWKKLSADSFTAYIDLSGYAPGSYNLPVNVATQVSDLQIISKNPSSLVVTIEQSEEKDVSVVAKISGNPAENMIAGEVTFDPATVKISGPKSIIEGISQMQAEIVLSGESTDFSKSMKPLALDSQGKIIEIINVLPPSVVANVKIVKAGNIKSVGIKVVTSGAPANGFYVSSISATPAVVSIIGTPETIRSLTSISTVAIDISGASKTIATQAKLNLPLGVRADGDISTVSTTINFAEVTVSKPLTIPLKTKNLPANMKILSNSPQTVDIVASGPASVISDLNSESIFLFLDLKNAISGANSITISADDFVLPSGVTIVSFQPQSITVTCSQM